MRYSVKLPTVTKAAVVVAWNGEVIKAHSGARWAVGMDITRFVREVNARGGKLTITGTGQ